MKSVPNPALDLAPFGRWTLRDEAAPRRSALRYADRDVSLTPYLRTIGFVLTHQPSAVECHESRPTVSFALSGWHRLKVPNRTRLTTLCAAAFAVAFVSGCAQATWCEYEPQVVALDERNEVVISTFPSALAQVRRRVPFLFKSYHSPPSVNLQFFVRATGTAGGRNPHIDSLLVRSFSYEFPGHTPVRLLENYADGFWQQGQSQYQSDKLEPVGCFEGWYIHARFDLMLNGRNFTGEDTLFARERTRRYPLVFDALR